MYGSCISELSEFSTATSMVHKPNWQNQFEWYLHASNLRYFRSLLDSSSHCTVWKQNWICSSCWVIFFTTNLKNEKGGKHISWPIWGALHQLPTFVPFVSLISLIPNHRRRFGFPTSAPSPDWKASEAWWNHPRVQWMVLHKSFEKSRGFWVLGSRPSVDRETLEKMAWKWTNLCEKTGMTLPSHGHGGQKLEGFGP